MSSRDGTLMVPVSKYQSGKIMLNTDAKYAIGIIAIAIVCFVALGVYWLGIGEKPEPPASSDAVVIDPAKRQGIDPVKVDDADNSNRDSESRHIQLADASKQVHKAVRDIYRNFMQQLDLKPSNNDLALEKYEANIERVRQQLHTVLSQPYVVHRLDTFVNKIERRDSGEVVLHSTLLIYKGKTASAMATCLFTVRNTECLAKIATLEPPCFVKINGRYTGVFGDNEFTQSHGYYELYYDLDDIHDE